MQKPVIFIFTAIMVFISTCSQEQAEKFALVPVKGGTFRNTKSNYYATGIKISDFYIGRYEITQKEWIEVMYNNPSQFKGVDLPVEMVSWYDCVEYCNKRSIKEGFTPYYNLNKHIKDPDNLNNDDDMKWTVTINAGTDGYRLPTEAEWEYAAGGGRKSRSYLFSGSNNPDDVGWYWKNSGDNYLTGLWSWTLIENNHNKSKAVGSAQPNELKLYDMSGNVREWCWEWYQDPASHNDSTRVLRGGGWFGGDFSCEVSFRGHYRANGIGPDTGFRVCRSQ